MNARSQKPPSEPVLSLQGFGVAFGEKTILANIDLTLPESGCTVLLGPSGTGKSTLLRTLAGFNDANPGLRVWGEARYQGDLMATTPNRPALSAQNARMMMASILENLVHELPERRKLSPLQQREFAANLLKTAGLGELADRIDEPVIHLDLARQRHLSILRLASPGTPLLLLDEPTTGIAEADVGKILDYIAAESSRRSIFITVHNQNHARRLGGQSILIAGGVVQETAPTEVFFTAPSTEPGRAFVRTGSCSVPAPDADPATLDIAAPPPAATPVAGRGYVSDSYGPRGFLWLKNGQLAGTPRPGIVQDLDYDLKALKRAGITHVISLTETPPESARMADFGLENIWCPFKDMTAPAITQAAGLCKGIQKIIKDGGVVAVHCRAGLGRTGTILAAYLIWEGLAALDALESARRVEPRWVQSDAQAEFLEKYARFLARRATAGGHKN